MVVGPTFALYKLRKRLATMPGGTAKYSDTELMFMKLVNTISAGSSMLLLACATAVHAAPANLPWCPDNPPTPQPAPEPAGMTALVIGMLAMALIIAFRKFKAIKSV